MTDSKPLPEDNEPMDDAAQADWDALADEEVSLDQLSEAGDIRQDPAREEEDDDNPMQDSDEALPDDEDERVLTRDPSKEGSRFGEV
ncbi:hypothetical protein QBK99_02160 [Corticibacterium sp. UT-5YL-CI-8]|nr:hypothetical protein [Tianweitania sp. UT-5YL-CI-8]